jgi:CRP-like cAMP-binding protein
MTTGSQLGISSGTPVRASVSPTWLRDAPNRPITRSTSTLPMTNRLLVNLPQAELNELRPHLTRVRLVSDQVLLEHGRPAEHVFFIEDGLASLVVETERGQAGVQVAMIGREGMVGSLALLDSESATYATAVMQIPGPALRIPTAKLRQCMESCPVLRQVCLRFVQSLTRQIMNIAAYNARNTVAERCVSRLLMAHERIDGDDLPLTHEALSIMLGVRRSGVTVATAALQKAGLIRTSRGRIRILDREGLEAFLNRGLPANGDDGAISPAPAQDAPHVADATDGSSLSIAQNTRKEMDWP